MPVAVPLHLRATREGTALEPSVRTSPNPVSTPAVPEGRIMVSLRENRAEMGRADASRYYAVAARLKYLDCLICSSPQNLRVVVAKPQMADWDNPQSAA